MSVADVGGAVTVVAAVSLIAAIRLRRQHLLGQGPWTITLLSLATYLFQMGTGIAMSVKPHDHRLVNVLAYIVSGGFAVALGRAWSLIQGEHLPAKQTRPAAPHDC